MIFTDEELASLAQDAGVSVPTMVATIASELSAFPQRIILGMDGTTQLGPGFPHPTHPTMVGRRST